MKIKIGKKLNTTNLFEIIETYWDQSFRLKTIIFDFSILEWISNSEVTFLSGWIRSLARKGIVVTIQLQQGNNIPSTSKEYERRKYCLEKLVRDWNFIKLLPSPWLVSGQTSNPRCVSPRTGNYFGELVRGDTHYGVVRYNSVCNAQGDLY